MDAAALGLQIAGIASTALVGVLAWSLRRNVVNTDQRSERIESAVGKVETDVRQLSSTVGAHASRLEAGNVRFEEMDRRHAERARALERRVEGLEERERNRCNECRFQG